MSKYPPYACSCCGFANADMFYDHYNFEPTDNQIMEFRAYRKVWAMLQKEREKAREITSKSAVYKRMFHNQPKDGGTK